MRKKKTMKAIIKRFSKIYSSNSNIKTFVNVANFLGYDCFPNFPIIFTVLLKIDRCFFSKLTMDLIKLTIICWN